MEKILISPANKIQVFQQVADQLFKLDYKITNLDIERPWGFYFYIDDTQTNKFIADFYGGIKLEGIDTSLPLQPKILAVEPNKKLSWQYHHRRSEIWRIVGGKLDVISSKTDNQSMPETLVLGKVITNSQGIRHRAVGTDEWGVFAEIWQHTDPNNPSDEDDIVRVQDDYGR